MQTLGTCPACGHETLETVEMDIFTERDPILTQRQAMILFECAYCHWQGSTGTLNMV